MLEIVHMGPSIDRNFAKLVESELKTHENELRPVKRIELHYDALPFTNLKSKFGPKGSSSNTLRVLLRFEPKVVLPFTYRNQKDRYDLIIDFGREGQQSLPWPQEEESLHLVADVSAERLDSFCLISADKFSPIMGELYSLRKKLALNSREVVLFGRAWGTLGVFEKIKIAAKGTLFATLARSRISPGAIATWFRSSPRSEGEIERKSSTYLGFKYAVVIENEASYVSEKLFDALSARCLPVYVGPTNKYSMQFESLIVRSEANENAVKLAFERAKGVDFEAWIRALEDYFPRVSSENSRVKVARNLAMMIRQNLPQ